MSAVTALLGFGWGLAAASLVAGFWGAPPASVVRYLEWLERELCFLRSPLSGRRFLALQAAGVVSGLGLVLLALPWGGVLGLLAAVAPLGLPLARRRRIARLEVQVEGWLGALGRALEAAPSLGEALAVSAEMVDVPLKDEMQQTLSEMHLGLSVDRALAAMGRRVRSRTLSLALVTLAVGRETGGELPEVLRKSAASLRELTRLEGVLRTKTAEGKMQALVISIAPAPLYLAIHLVDPTYFVPLETTSLGHLLFALAAVLWLAAGFLSFKILSVQM